MPVNPGANRANKPANVKELKGRTPKPKARTQREGTNLTGRRTKEDPKVNPNRRRGRRRGSKGQPSHKTVMFLWRVATEQFPHRGVNSTLDVIVKRETTMDAVQMILDRDGFRKAMNAQRSNGCLRGASYTTVTKMVVDYQEMINEMAEEAKARGKSLGDMRFAVGQ